MPSVFCKVNGKHVPLYREKKIGGDAMSLFGNDEFQWRETYFVLFRNGDRPPVDDVVDALTADDRRFQVHHVRQDNAGRLESLTLMSPDDFAGMDISYVTGEEVTEQVEETRAEMAKATLTAEDREKLAELGECDARFDIFHFEQVTPLDDGEDEEILDPGALLIVIEKLCLLCNGVGIDPQSGSLM
ncbi:MAG: hypothetical protein ACC628_02635 [Pirellulaceae bacterium]